ncbi:hypothetical protein MUK42_02259 [Musa troglodytarum]|uniref:Rapid alkalinization factor n=1 Tax=Musa troglodytarum TaxID=320322 RepID=A0A9E7EQY9_9LILI|nr:hypothetical protein MUK42_02259 [Musa troglodytarum]
MATQRATAPSPLLPLPALAICMAALLLASAAEATPPGGFFTGAVDEFVPDSEVNRRILASTQDYLSYNMLRADSVPCSRRGAAYGNCRPGAEANPYDRGCSQITQCRS